MKRPKREGDSWWKVIAEFVRNHPGVTKLEIGIAVHYPEPHKRLSDLPAHGWQYETHEGQHPYLDCRYCQRAREIGIPTYTVTAPAEVDRASYPDNPLLRPTSGAEAPTAGAEGAAHLDERPPEPLPENADQLLAEALSKLQRIDLADKIRAAA